VGIFNRVVPTQFWSLANDVYSPEEGKRLFVIVAFGASAGAVFGGLITRQLIGFLGVNQLLLVSAGILLFATFLTNVVDSREHQRRALRSSEEAKKEEAPMSKQGAFRLVLGTRYLLFIALLMMVLNWVNTNGEFILGNSVAESVKRMAAAQLGSGASPEEVDRFVRVGIGEFYATFFTGVNVLGLLVQLFLVSRVLKYLGVRVALMILPAIALGGYALLAMIPVLSVIRWAKTAENATDYSLQNTVREALFLPMSREEKYKAKQATDTFFWRAGDVLSAGLVYVGLNWLTLSTQGFALVNMALVAVWIVLALAIGREYKRRTAGIGES
jgi:AAA family ATP:ADP antiporter